jgi:hypothetical protein
MLFFLKKMVTPFILPPGFLVVILGLIGGWTILKKDRVCGLLTASAGALLWLLSIGPTADLLKSGLERPYRPAPHIEADVILMLGGDLYDRSADFSGIGAPGPGTMERLVTAARLHRRYPHTRGPVRWKGQPIRQPVCCRCGETLSGGSRHSAQRPDRGRKQPGHL